jgi:hypothetical protein
MKTMADREFRLKKMITLMLIVVRRGGWTLLRQAPGAERQ